MFFKLLHKFRFIFDVSNDEVESYFLNYIDEHPDELQEILQKSNCKDSEEFIKKIRGINWNEVITRMY